MLQDRVAGETAEERRRRMLEAQQRRLLGSAATPATVALFGAGPGGGFTR